MDAKKHTWINNCTKGDSFSVLHLMNMTRTCLSKISTFSSLNGGKKWHFWHSEIALSLSKNPFKSLWREKTVFECVCVQTKRISTCFIFPQFLKYFQSRDGCGFLLDKRSGLFDLSAMETSHKSKISFQHHIPFVKSHENWLTRNIWFYHHPCTATNKIIGCHRISIPKLITKIGLLDLAGKFRHTWLWFEEYDTWCCVKTLQWLTICCIGKMYYSKFSSTGSYF